MVASTHPARSHRHIRRRTYHMLGGEGHSDFWVKVVDRALIALISLNALAAILESVEHLSIAHGPVFHTFDLISVGIFSVEYALRVWTAVEHEDPRFRHPLWGRLRYMATPMAIIDLLAVAPFYLGMVLEFDGRTLRVLRLLRVFKLTRYSSAMHVLAAVLRQEARAIGAVLFILAVVLLFTSSLMYFFEHHAQPQVFRDIPTSMWWGIVTLTTLGYGDIVPITAMGRILGGATAVIGVGMIALPAGVLASGFSEQMRQRREEYVETVEKALQDGRLTSHERRLLEQAREDLGLSHDDAARLLEAVRKGEFLTHCPHCGGDLHHDRAALAPEKQ